MDGSFTSGTNKFVRASIALPSIGGTTVHANAVATDPAEDRPLPDDAISTLHCQYQVSGKSPTPYRVVMHIGGKPVGSRGTLSG